VYRGDPFPVRTISLDPVHSGAYIASDVRVMILSTPRVRTPFEGSVKGVQCGGVDVVDEVGLGLAMLIICRSSIVISSRPCRRY
jgi:hypothetical protein